jgi:CheY-like chemotaxis protein/HPt (histidine-containing phosphotransfer) domain-containing protein
VAGASAPVKLTGIRALVVDDNATNRGIVKEMLVQAGAAVDEAPDATSALAEHTHALTTGTPYHIAVLDSQMPGRDGWSLAATLRGNAAEPRTHLLMLASSTERGDAERCREIGIDGYMLKPVSRVDLLEAIASVLSGRGAHGTPVTRNAMAEARVRLRILVAEDNSVNQEVVAAMLRKRGHLVTLVDDGAKAVAAVTGGLFDVILMDIHMPVMDGLVATAAIRRLPAGALLPIIALTADALAGEREHCLAAGMNGYLSKPFKSHELFASVEGWGAAPGPDTSSPSARQAPPVDVDGFRATMREAGAEDAVDSILDSFLADAPARISAVVDAVAGGVASEIESTAHAFKSSAGVIGAGVLAGQLLALELAGHDARVSAARTLVTDMHAEAAAVIAQLADLRKEAVAGA